jgi:hypothetical protein
MLLCGSGKRINFDFQFLRVKISIVSINISLEVLQCLHAYPQKERRNIVEW